MVGRAHADQEFGHIRVTTADWPIVLTDFPEERTADADLHATLDCLASLMREATRTRQKLFFITDLTPMRETPTASQRQYTGAWTKTNAELSRASSVGGATVTPSPILRGIITAVYWVQPPPTPSFSVATRHEAMLKGIELLKAADVLLPPRLLAYRERQEHVLPPAVGRR
jgi:hypothetical protein